MTVCRPADKGVRSENASMFHSRGDNIIWRTCWVCGITLASFKSSQTVTACVVSGQAMQANFDDELTSMRRMVLSVSK